MNINERINYLEEGFKVPIERNNHCGYASINTEMICDGSEMAPTGHYFIYLLHPLKGSLHFTIEQEIATGLWFLKESEIVVEPDILQEIGTAINFKLDQLKINTI